jgi:hemoglobin-like flavoprotein
VRLFRRTKPSEVVIRPAEDWTPEDRPFLTEKGIEMTNDLESTGSHTLDPDMPVAGRPPAPTDIPTERLVVAPARTDCPHCRGTGKTLTTNDLLRESLELLGNAGDDVIREFYRRLLDAAPHLADLFPPDLLTEIPRPNAEGEVRTMHGGPQQRDKLLSALTALAQLYDPTRAEQMAVLDTHLATFGRSHANFARPDGTVRGATLDEYQAVKVVLFGTLHDFAGAAWLSEYDDVWSEAYDYAAGAMLFHSMRTDAKSARYARS